MSKPLIGISCDLLEQTMANNRKRQVQKLNDSYVEAVKGSGGIPVIIPNGLNDEDIKELSEKLDGFIFSGGGDIDPEAYGKEPDNTLIEVWPERDQSELLLLRYVLNDSAKPVLCICRGLQILNVFLGGTLIIDLPNAGKNVHSFNELPRDAFSHEIVVEENSKLKTIIKDETQVNSFHHQAIDKLGEGLVISAYSKEDRVIEAVEIPGERYIMGVQWHPEELRAHASHKALFDELIKQAAKNRL